MRARYLVPAFAVVLCVTGLLFVFVLSSDDLYAFNGQSISPYDHNTYVLITTERAVGIALIWMASLLACWMAGKRLASLSTLAPTKVILLAAAAVGLLGLFMIFVLGGQLPSLAIGSFNSAGNQGRRMPFLLYLQTEREIGFVLVWVASAVVASISRQKHFGTTSQP